MINGRSKKTNSISRVYFTQTMQFKIAEGDEKLLKTFNQVQISSVLPIYRKKEEKKLFNYLF